MESRDKAFGVVVIEGVVVEVGMCISVFLVHDSSQSGGVYRDLDVEWRYREQCRRTQEEIIGQRKERSATVRRDVRSRQYNNQCSDRITQC